MRRGRRVNSRSPPISSPGRFNLKDSPPPAPREQGFRAAARASRGPRRRVARLHYNETIRRFHHIVEWGIGRASGYSGAIPPRATTTAKVPRPGPLLPCIIRPPGCKDVTNPRETKAALNGRIGKQRSLDFTTRHSRGKSIPHRLPIIADTIK